MRPFFGTPPLKMFFFSKITQNKVKGSFFLEKGTFIYVLFDYCHYFLNETMDKI